MPKRIYFNSSYTSAMTADFLQQERYPMLIFFESRKISIENVLEFRCTSTLSNMLKQNIINSNAGSILVSEQLKVFLLSMLPVDGV